MKGRLQVSRAALLTAAVTGKIDMRTHSKTNTFAP